MKNEEAKKYIKSKMCNDCDVYLGGGKCSDNCKVIEAINTLEQEPKTGHWIGGDGHYICSCCKYDPLDFLEPLGLDGGSYMAIPMKYCPQCGAKMAEGSKE